MPIKNPNTPYERAYNAWSYGGGKQRGEPMPRARDFASESEDDERRREYSEYQRRSSEPYAAEAAAGRSAGWIGGQSGMGAGGIWQGPQEPYRPQEPYQEVPPMDNPAPYDPRRGPWGGPMDGGRPGGRQMRNGGWYRPGGELEYVPPPTREIQAQQGGYRDRQRRLAESPAVVQAARAYEQRRGRPRGRTSLGALNRR